MAFVRIVGPMALIALTVGPATAAHAADTPQPPIGVQVQAAAGDTPGLVNYQVEVRNSTDTPQVLIVKQQLPLGATAIAASDAGVVAENGEVSWRLETQPAEVKPVTVGATYSGALPAQASSACVTVENVPVLQDCAASGAIAVRASKQAKQIPWAAIGAIALPILAVGLGLFLARRRIAAGWKSMASRYLPPARQWIVDHRSVLATSGAFAVVALLALGGALLVGVKAKSMLPSEKAAKVGWGVSHAASLGRPVTTESVEFTVYQFTCKTAVAGQCQATVGVRNLTDKPQPWLRGMQRLYTSAPGWQEPDAVGTAAANNGTDVFAGAFAPQERRLMTLVFVPPADASVSRLELRKDVFTSGITLDLN